MDSLRTVAGWIDQLKNFYDFSDNKEKIAADLRAYEEILFSGCGENADNFLRLKYGHIGDGEAFGNNEEVITKLKGMGMWNGKSSTALG